MFAVKLRATLPKDECVICLSEIKESQKIRLKNCKHVFCRVCIYDWMCDYETTCPCCRASFSDIDIKNANVFGVIYGLLAPTYQLSIDFQKFTPPEFVAFAYMFQLCAEKRGLLDVLTQENIDFDTFKQIMYDVNYISVDMMINFNTKTTIKSKFIGYTKTRNYSDYLQHGLCDRDDKLIIKNFFL